MAIVRLANEARVWYCVVCGILTEVNVANECGGMETYSETRKAAIRWSCGTPPCTTSRSQWGADVSDDKL